MDKYFGKITKKLGTGQNFGKNYQKMDHWAKFWEKITKKLLALLVQEVDRKKEGEHPNDIWCSFSTTPGLLPKNL